MEPSAQQLEQLAAIWDSQAQDDGPVVDYSDPSFSVPLAVAVHPTDPAALAEHFLNLWTWARWVRIYAKPPQAVLAASRLAAAQGKPKAVSWMAPGTGHPLSSPAASREWRCCVATGPPAPRRSTSTPPRPSVKD